MIHIMEIIFSIWILLISISMLYDWVICKRYDSTQRNDK